MPPWPRKKRRDKASSKKSSTFTPQQEIRAEGGSTISNVTQIISSLSPLMRAVLLVTLSVASLTLVGVAFLALKNALPAAPPSPPDLDRFEVIGSPDSNLAITALAARVDDDRLWIGTQSGDQYALYQLDTARRSDAILERVRDVEEQIIDLAIDHKGNVWLSLNERGVRVYQPRTGEYSALLNKTETNGWLEKNTVFAIATRRTEDDAAEVWLGRKGVHTLRYHGDYPFRDARELVPWDQDDVFQASKGLADDVRALYYATEEEKLWIADGKGILLSFSFKRYTSHQVDSGDPALWALSQSAGGVVWAGGSKHLIQIGAQDQVTPVPLARNGISLNSRAHVIAAGGGQPWVWFGDRCLEPSTLCRPLGVYAQGHLFCVDDLGKKEVRDIAIDQTGAVWIGTEAGIVFYPAP